MFTILATVAVKSAMIFALAWVITKMMRRRSAAARHLVWTSAIAAVLMLPVASLWVPAWHLPAPAAWSEAAAVFQVSATAADDPESATIGRSNPATAQTGHIAVRNWRAIILSVWAFGSALVLLQMLLGYAAIWRLRRSMTRSVGHVDGVEILESPAGTMPMTAGIWKPAVFLPADSSAWPDSRRRAVLAHELAHVRRSDAATQLLARARGGVVLVESDGVARMARILKGTRAGCGRHGAGSGLECDGLRRASARYCAEPQRFVRNGRSDGAEVATGRPPDGDSRFERQPQERRTLVCRGRRRHARSP